MANFLHMLICRFTLVQETVQAVLPVINCLLVPTCVHFRLLCDQGAHTAVGFFEISFQLRKIWGVGHGNAALAG